MMEGFSQIMILEATAEYLKIGISTFYRRQEEGKIPAVEIEFIDNNMEVQKAVYP